MKKLLYILMVAPLLFFSCNQDEIVTFEDDIEGIYFQTGGQTRLYLNIDQYYDSTAYSFAIAGDTVTQHTLSARLRTMGKVRDYDRPVKVVVDQEHTTAVEGKHFRVDFSKIVIPAGESEVQVPVTFFRTPDMQNQQFDVSIKVEPNEYFTVPFTTQKNTNVYYDQGQQIKADRYVFTVSEIYTRPSYWDIFGQEFFGDWTVNKFKYVNKICEIPASDWNNAGSSYSKVRYGRFKYYAIMVRNALQAAADAGTPVLDDDGSYMQLSPAYEVDYSAYY